MSRAGWVIGGLAALFGGMALGARSASAEPREPERTPAAPPPPKPAPKAEPVVRRPAAPRPVASAQAPQAAQPGGGAGQPWQPGDQGATGTGDEVPGYARRDEQTFGPDDGVTPIGIGKQFDFAIRAWLERHGTQPHPETPTILRLTIAGFRWVPAGETPDASAGAYRYIVSNPVSAVLYGYTAEQVAANVAAGEWKQV